MTRDIVRVRAGVTLGEVARTLRARNVGSAVVVGDDDVPRGIITERELVDSVAASRSPDLGLAESWMKPDPATVAPGAGLEEASELMRAADVRHLTVTEDGRLVGVVSIRDLLRGAL
jgi:signal-transduction protein with cAMP-binding, CBS, and nucleotidyltransferase domain